MAISHNVPQGLRDEFIGVEPTPITAEPKGLDSVGGLLPPDVTRHNISYMQQNFYSTPASRNVMNKLGQETIPQPTPQKTIHDILTEQEKAKQQSQGSLGAVSRVLKPLAEGADQIQKGMQLLYQKGDVLRGVGYVANGVLQGGMSAIPAVAVLNAVQPYVTQIGEKAAEQIGVDKKIGAKIANYLTLTPFGWKVLAGVATEDVVGSVANQIVENTDMRPQDKKLVENLVGNVAFFTGMGVAGKVSKKISGMREKVAQKANAKKIENFVNNIKEKPTEPIPDITQEKLPLEMVKSTTKPKEATNAQTQNENFIQEGAKESTGQMPAEESGKGIPKGGQGEVPKEKEVKSSSPQDKIPTKVINGKRIKKKSKKYYYINSNEEGFQEAQKANKVDLGDGGDYFIYKDSGREKPYRVVDSITGLFISKSKNRKEAINIARTAVEKRASKIEELRGLSIENSGLSPRYEYEKSSLPQGKEAEKGSQTVPAKQSETISKAETVAKELPKTAEKPAEKVPKSAEVTPFDDTFEASEILRKESITNKYIREIENSRKPAKEKLESMGFKVKELPDGNFEISDGEIRKLHENHISTEHKRDKIIITGNEFPNIAELDLGNKKKLSVDNNIPAVERMLGEGKSVRDIAKALGLSVRETGGIVKKLKVGEEMPAKVKEAYKNVLGKTRIGADPSLFKDLITIGKYEFEQLAKKLKNVGFRDFAKRMIEKLGNGVRKVLRKIWDGVRPSAKSERVEELLNARKGYKGDFKEVVKKLAEIKPPEEKPEFELEPQSLKGFLNEGFYDEFARLLEAEQKAGDIKPEESAYLEHKTYIAKAAHKLERLVDSLQNGKDGLFDRLKEKKYTPLDLALYMYAKHAPERNAELGGGRKSGLTDAEAAQILSKLDVEGLEPFAKEFRKKVIEPMLDLLYESGRLKKEEYERIKNKYQYYVPMKGLDNYVSEIFGSKKIDVRGKSVRRAYGRESIPDNVVYQAIYDYKKAIIEAHKNKVGQKFLDFVDKHPNENLYETNVQAKIPYYDKNGDVAGYKAENLKDNEIGVWKDGKLHIITIKDEPLLRVFRNTSPIRGFQFLQRFDNLLRLAYTVRNPNFTITNFLRDFQLGIANLTAEQSGKIAAKVSKETPKAILGIAEELFGKGKSEYREVYRDLKENGGEVSWLDTGDVHKLERDFEKALNQGHTKRALMKLVELIDKSNQAIEMGIRTATYKVLLDEGYSKIEAVRAARDLTLDFNQKGRFAPWYDTFWLFTNARFLGIQRMMKLFKSKGGKKVLGAIVLGSAMGNIINRLVNPDEYAQESTYERDHYWRIPMPLVKDHKITIPIGYGVNLPFVIGNVLTDIAFDGLKPKVAMQRLIGGLADTFNPFPTGSNLVQIFTPTFARPIVDVAMNRNWLNYPIAQPQSPYEPEKPEHERKMKNVNKILDGFTEFLAKERIADINPSVIEYLFSGYTGGAGVTAKQVVSTALDILKGKIPPVRDIPILSKVVKKERPENKLAKIYVVWRESEKTLYSAKERTQFYKMLNETQKEGILKNTTARRMLTQFNKAQVKQVTPQLPREIKIWGRQLSDKGYKIFKNFYEKAQYTLLLKKSGKYLNFDLKKEKKYMKQNQERAIRIAKVRFIKELRKYR